MQSLSFSVAGTPVAKKRPRFARVGKGVRTYSDQQTDEGRFLVIVLETIKNQETIPKGTPVELSLDFIMPRPKGHYRTGKHAGELKPSAPTVHTKKPDLDNLVKFVKDCLNGQLWHDDSQVSAITAQKQYGEKPRTDVAVMWESNNT